MTTYTIASLVLRVLHTRTVAIPAEGSATTLVRITRQPDGTYQKEVIR